MGAQPVASEARASPGWLACAAVAGLALAVRLVHLWQIRGFPLFDHLVGDARAFDEWAREIVAGDWAGTGVFYQVPLYPYFLAGIYAVAGRNLVVVRIVQAVLGAVACVLLARAGGRVFGRTVGLLAAALLAVWPSAVFADGLIQKSALDTLLLCAFVVTVLGAAARPTAATWGTTGLVLGTLVLTRENALAFVPVLLGLAAVRFRKTARSAFRAGVALGLGLAMVLLPVAVRNRVVGGEFHLTTANFGPNFFIGNNPAATGMYGPLRYGRGDARYERLDATELAEHAVGRPLTPGEVSRWWTGRGLAFVRDAPGRWLALIGRKATLFVNRVEVGDAEDQYTYAEWSAPVALLQPVLNFGLLVPLAVAGVVLGWGRHRDVPLLALLLVVYSLSVIGMFVMARFRHPALPLLLLFAAEAIVTVVGRGGDRRGLALAAVVAACAAVPANWPLVAESAVRAAGLYNVGRSLADRPGGLEPAIAYYRRAIAMDPQHALAHNNLGVALQQRGDLAEALVQLRRAVELQPARGDHHYNLAAALAAVGDGDGAVASYERAIALDPTNADAHTNLGALLQQRGRLDAAIAHYDAALAINPRNVPALNNRGTSYASLGKLNQAIDSFSTALAIDPRARSARENRATALAGAGRRDEAAADYAALAQLLASSPGGDASEAVAVAERARALGGDARLDVAEALAAAFAAAGRRDAAVDAGRHAAELAARAGNEAAMRRTRDWLSAHPPGSRGPPPPNFP